ncbi:MAG: hypothetical protein M3416_16980 [Acidobacteriota bacterium]|nr:hypothetical protein [Acidobacteriota bacterium]
MWEGLTTEDWVHYTFPSIRLLIFTFFSLANKDWSIYPFIPPTLSIFLSLYLVPMYDKLYGANLRRHLGEKGMTDYFDLVNGIAKERGLQVAYLTGILSFLSSMITTLKSNYPFALTILSLFLFFVGLALILNVFMREPGYLSTTMFPERRKLEFLDERGWTYLKLYSYILTAFNVFLIILIIIALPERPSPCPAPCPPR